MEELESSEKRDCLSEFTLAEIVEMENLYKVAGEQSLGKEFCQDFVKSYSSNLSRAGKSAITWEQVQNWFQNKHEELQAKNKSIMDISELAFEAKSSKDNAWYDVASFRSYRILSSGEHEVYVRFAGFGKDEDEWVNLRNSVRERSIPLEPSECHKVNVGDLVLCFKERENQAVYRDAHVIEVQRRLHDVGACMCVFVVRYDDDDNTEENVHLGRLCSRPAGCDSSSNSNALVEIDTQQEMIVDEKWKLSFLY